MHRLFSPEECRKITDKYPDYFTFNCEDWLSKPTNFAYQEGENVGFGECKSPGNFWVHFCFHTARGRQAVNLTKRMFDRLCEDTGLVSAIGLIHVDNKPAKWVIRQVGFKSLGTTETENGLCEMFYSTRKDLNGI
jgi:hypothetical protein